MSTRLTSDMKMRWKSMRPMSGTQIIKVRITIQTMHKIDQKRLTPLTIHQTSRIIPHKSSSQYNNSNPGYRYSKSNQQEKPVNVSVMLHGPVSKEQLYKIQEVLRHPSQYRDRIKPEDHPVKGEYANAFNKFHPKKVEVNEATVEEAIKYGQFLKKSKEDIAEAIDIYKTLGNETLYGPEEDPVDLQEQPQQ